ncbi:hypothetical protein FACS1894109_05010 [Spirochaetia bacterium]|nr:hypothetical protein FACS1894109_05010 [Spirochaetia bacterium]
MKKLQIFGMLAMVLSLAFTGCSDPTVIEGNVGNYAVAHGPNVDASTITVEKGTGIYANHLVVNYKPADNSMGNQFYISVDKKVLVQISSFYTNFGYGYKADGGNLITTGIPDYTKTGVRFLLPAGNADTNAYYVGIRSYDPYNYGDIVWSATAVAAN